MEDRLLYQELKEYCKGETYPFHMPGHKRNPAFFQCFPGLEVDITEIYGFDNLHHPEGILKNSQEKAAGIYGVKETFFSVNGSTAAILSAISACVKKEGGILVARNCHKAVYHSIYLRNLNPYYVYPQWNQECGLNGGILASDVDKLLKEHPDIQAVVITSPTYDGIVSDVRAISRTVHSYGIPLIVDEAHGAHFLFSGYFPDSAINSGADVVIQSIHKTLPALTQTALLHRVTDRVDRELLARFMGMYQSSSPSYVLMSSIDACMHLVENSREILFPSYIRQLADARKKLESLKNIRLIGKELVGKYGIYDMDLSKIVLSVKNCGISGHEFSRLLRERFCLEMEMDTDSYVLALTSAGDREEGFNRLVHAARILDQELTAKEQENKISSLPVLEKKMSPGAAMDLKMEKLPLEESVGRISGEFAYLYPPGIPLVVPGECISLQLVEDMRRYQEQGLELQGLEDFTGRTISVIHG